MGIDRFFSSIEDNIITKDFSEKHDNILDVNYLLIDFFSIIYINTFKVLYDLNHLLYQIILNKSNKKSQKTMKYYDLDITSPEQFSKIMTEEAVSDLIIKEIILYVQNLLKNSINSEMLEYLYIAIDGVASRAKMDISRSRRYLGVIMGGIKKKIYEKHIDDIRKHDIRYKYEKYKLSRNTSVFTSPGTKFLDDVYKELVTDDFKNKVKQICPNIKNYTCSSQYEPGEGEMKIVRHLRSLDGEKSNYLIYSPDSDVILLCLL